MTQYRRLRRIRHPGYQHWTVRDTAWFTGVLICRYLKRRLP